MAANGDGLSLLLSCVGVDVKLDGKAGQLDVRVPSVAPVFKRVVTLVTLGMVQHTFKNVNNCLNTNIYSYLETSGG